MLGGLLHTFLLYYDFNVFLSFGITLYFLIPFKSFKLMFELLGSQPVPPCF